MKLCIDCKHCHDLKNGVQYLRCVNPKNMTINPVDGSKTFKDFEYCSTHRKDLDNTCTSAALWFEPLEVEK